MIQAGPYCRALLRRMDFWVLVNHHTAVDSWCYSSIDIVNNTHQQNFTEVTIPGPRTLGPNDPDAICELS